ncbi:MAG TPA: AAA family ATPase, partial [Syntrophobacteraceae bacterium]|nr:AAA family ATPase [Syntrophobacteraceae bacterium]
MSVDVKRINEQVLMESRTLQRLRLEVKNVIVGQTDLIDRLLVGILCNGHVLIEGVPGLAKTLTVTTLAKAMQTSF